MAKWDNIQHGNAATYRSQLYACRCEPCTKANSARALKEREARFAKGLDEGDPRHGTDAGYSTWGCACDPCREAHNAKVRARNAEKRKLNGGS